MVGRAGRAALLAAVLLATADAPAEGAGHCRTSVHVEPAAAFVGQRVTWRVEILRARDVRSLEWLEPPSFPGFRVHWLPGVVRPEPVERDGRAWLHSVESRALFPARVGRLRIQESSLRCDGAAVPVAASLVEVSALPAAGRPPGFSGLVGPVRVVTRLDPERVALGESARLWIILRGAGNLWSAPTPLGETDIAGVDVFPERPALEIDADPELSVRRTFRYRLVPRREGRIPIPEVTVAWFDADSGGYRSARGPARTLTVGGTAILGAEE